MRGPGGATLPEIMETTSWQAHTVRGFVSILGGKGRAEDRILQERRRRTNVPNLEIARASTPASKRRLRLAAGRRSCFRGRLFRPRK